MFTTNLAGSINLIACLFLSLCLIVFLGLWGIKDAINKAVDNYRVDRYTDDDQD